jgi:hypothetical protein
LAVVLEAPGCGGMPARSGQTSDPLRRSVRYAGP